MTILLIMVILIQGSFLLNYYHDRKNHVAKTKELKDSRNKLINTNAKYRHYIIDQRITIHHLEQKLKDNGNNL
jgi:hypothetical protein